MRGWVISAALLLTGCVCNLNWQRYHVVGGTREASSTVIMEDFVVQIIATDHSGKSGLASDLSEPYSVHTELVSRTAVAAYEVEGLWLGLEHGERKIYDAKERPIRVPCPENENGLHIGRQTFKDLFSDKAPTIQLRMEGRVYFEDRDEFFSYRGTFRFAKGKKRWISLNDMMTL